MYKIITPPTVEPVTLDEARMQCRADEDVGIDGNSSRYDDALFIDLISGARAWVESHTGLLLAPRTVEIARDAFPACPMTLEGFPVASITSVKYIDGDEIEQTMDGATYYLDDYQNPASIIPKLGTSFPATAPAANAVKVRYVIGSTAIATDIKRAILMLVAYMYFNRGDDFNDGNYLGVPAVRALLAPHRQGLGV